MVIGRGLLGFGDAW